MVSGGGDIGRGLGHDSGALMNGISVLIEEIPERALVPSRGKDGHLWTRVGWSLGLGLPSLQSYEK